MELIFITEGRFIKKQDGLIYSFGDGFSDSVWDRYLAKFNKVTVMARVLSVTDDLIDSGEYLVPCNNVSFIELPYYIGPAEFLKKVRNIKKVINRNLVPGKAYICRVPGQIGTMVSKALEKENIPYAVEVVGDPWEVFAPGGLEHPFRFFFRYKGLFDLKRVVANSAAGLYVTCNSLQKRYPVKKSVFQISASDVQLSSFSRPSSPKILVDKGSYKLISIGSLAQMYKAPDILMKALSVLKKRNISCTLTWLGDGVFKQDMIALSERLGVADIVDFRGNVSSKEVAGCLSESDIFLLVSRTEGLPRALVEAMSMGLPCIGTSVGGIPELLEKSVLVPKNNVETLVDKIIFMLSNKDFTNKQAERNLKMSGNFDEAELQTRREAFLSKVIEISKE
ncbi:MAG: glycosyltransferase [Bacteroidales bacterium]|nr:glycosyltransferase [Bacteroidales bacterium]